MGGCDTGNEGDMASGTPNTQQVVSLFDTQHLIHFDKAIHYTKHALGHKTHFLTKNTIQLPSISYILCIVYILFLS